MDNEKYLNYLKSDKWKNIAKERMKIDGFTCCMCGSRGTPANVLEVHHVAYKAIYHEEERIYQDLVTVCRRCHLLLHTVMNRVTGPDGRHGWKDRSDIPQVHVFSLSGEDIDMEVKL